MLNIIAFLTILVLLNIPEGTGQLNSKTVVSLEMCIYKNKLFSFKSKKYNYFMIRIVF